MTKPINDPYEVHHLQCACSHSEHDLRIACDTESGDVWIEVQLNPNVKRWWERIPIALNYLMGSRVQCRYGAYDCTLLRMRDYQKIKDLLDRSLAAFKANGVEDNG